MEKENRIMSERKKLIIKLIILILLQIGCNYAIVGRIVLWESGYLFFSKIGVGSQVLLIMAVFQIIIYINYRVKRLATTKYKLIYIITDLFFTLITVLYWSLWIWPWI